MKIPLEPRAGVLHLEDSPTVCSFPKYLVIVVVIFIVSATVFVKVSFQGVFGIRSTYYRIRFGTIPKNPKSRSLLRIS